MISDYDFYNEGPRSASWEKVTRRTVDPITFSCHVNVTYVPRIEDCSYETTNIALSQPRFGEIVSTLGNGLTTASNGKRNGKFFATTFNRKPSISTPADDLAWTPQSFPKSKIPTKANSISVTSPRPKKSASLPVGSSPPKRFSPRGVPAKVSPGSPGKFKARLSAPENVPSLFASAVQTNSRPPKSSPVKGKPSTNVSSLGAFFSQTAKPKPPPGDSDNHSVGSRSIGSRSISERSNAERSKAEERIRNRKNRIAAGASARSGAAARKSSADSMMSIDEKSTQEFAVKRSVGGTLGKFLKNNSTDTSASKIDDDNKSTMSASTMGSKSISVRSTADRSKNETKLKSSAHRSVNKENKKVTSVATKSGGKRPSIQKKPLKSIMKKAGGSKKAAKIQISDDVDTTDFPCLDDDDYYKDWDDIWYSEEELGDMRYEAFLEEAGLDLEEFQ